MLHGSYSEVGVQVLFLVASYRDVVSSNSGSKLRLEQVRSLEGDCGGNVVPCRAISSVQEDVESFREIQNTKATLVHG